MIEKSVMNTVVLYSAAGVQLAVSVVAGLALGAYLDGRWGVSPWLAIFGTIIGTVGGIWNLVRILKLGEK